MGIEARVKWVNKEMKARKMCIEELGWTEDGPGVH
jgi:hypothetical protein